MTVVNGKLPAGRIRFIMWTITVLIISSVIMAVSSQTCSENVGSSCGTPLRRGLNSSEQATLLKDHNRLRNQVAAGNEKRGNPGPQPAASNMRLMTWDAEVAKLAQNWANQCTFAHNLCGGSSRFSVGQNLYALMSTSNATKINFTDAVMSWYNEVQYFNRSSVNPFVYLASAGHYTQLVWANSNYLGCGFIQYKESDTQWYRSYLVCDYAPAGNVIRGSMYNTTGQPCSTCSSKKCDSSYTALCV